MANNIVKVATANEFINKVNDANTRFKYDTLFKSENGLLNRGGFKYNYLNKSQTRNYYNSSTQTVNISSTSKAKVLGYSVFDYNTDDEGKYFQKAGAVVGAVPISEAITRLNACVGLMGLVVDSNQIMDYFKTKKSDSWNSYYSDAEIKEWTIAANSSSKDETRVLQYVINNKVYLDKKFIEQYIRVLYDLGAFTDDELDQIEIIIGQSYLYNFENDPDKLPWPINYVNILKEFINHYKIELTNHQYVQLVYMPDQYFDDWDDFVKRVGLGTDVDIQTFFDWISHNIDNTRQRFWLMVYPNTDIEFYTHSGLINKYENEIIDMEVSKTQTWYTPDLQAKRYACTRKGHDLFFDEDVKVYTNHSLAGYQIISINNRALIEGYSLQGPMLVSDNAIKGLGFHAQTGLDLDNTATVPTTREEALNPMTVWHQWYENSLYIVNDDEFDTEHVIALPVSTLDPDSDYLLEQDIAQLGSIYNLNKLNLSLFGNRSDDSAGGDNPDKPTDDIPNINPDDEDDGVIDDPIIPTTSAINSGLVVCYNPTETGLRNVSTWLWDNDITKPAVWDKILSSPMDALISLKGVFCTIPDRQDGYFSLGGVSTTIPMQKITKQFVEVNCGSITIPKTFNSVLDYNPYTKMTIWLPFIGFRQLDTDECMGSTITIKYVVDILTGDCVCNIRIAREGMSVIMYSEHGNCAIDFPLTAKRDMRLLSVLGTGAAAVASGGSTLLGGAIGLAESSSSKVNIQKIGNSTMSAGAMSVKKPYITIEKPQQAEATYFNSFYGYPNNQTVYLKNCSGYTKVKDIHLDGIIATENELKEIDSLLKQGVLL